MSVGLDYLEIWRGEGFVRVEKRSSGVGEGERSDSVS